MNTQRAMARVKEINLTVNKENFDDDIKLIIEELRPGWHKGNVSIQPLSGGHVNTTLKLVHNDDDDDGLVVRINGKLNIGIQSRSNEIKYIRLLNKNGIGIPLIATFNNGIVSKFVKGKPLNHKDMEGVMTDPQFSKNMAELLARMHYLSPRSTERPSRANYFVSRMVKAGLKNFRTKDFGDLSLITETVSWAEAEREMDFMFSEAEKLEIPVCFNHNDMWHANILYDRNSDKIDLIDFECVDFNYEPYDLAMFLLCATNGHLFSSSTPPGVKESEFSRTFIRIYLEQRANLEGTNDQVSDAEVDKYHHWTEVCKMLFLCIWPAYLCAMCGEAEKGVQIPFDFKTGFLNWYKDYMRRKQSFKF